ncbi:MAG: TrmB family transcriptional regulator [candidate division Zixibacteria bacterium]|nr:TrmB family transcriptional regulator [candidate division Zixibacteria bacterium]
MTSKDYTLPLQALGFTEIEALIYGFLVENSPATGYRISHAVGKQPPNTYKAIASLEDKGAIIVEVGERRLCRAVPPVELLDKLEQCFKQHRQEADRALKTLSSSPQDDGIYHLKTVDQVISQSIAMLDRAKGIVLCDLSPGPFSLLADSLRETATRGVRIICRVYSEVQIPDVITQQLTGYDPALDTWPGQQISIVVDAEEHLLGLLTKDMKGVHETVWSNSTYLSCLHHNHVASEILYTNLESGQANLSAEAEEKLKNISLLTFRPSGLETLIKRYRTTPPSFDQHSSEKESDD